MILIIEGVDGSGKSAISRALQEMIPLSTLVKLSGAPKKIKEESYMRQVYTSLIPFYKAVAEDQVVILDRSTTSERIYPPIFKGYVASYLDDYERFLINSFNVRQIVLSPTRELLKSRLQMKKQQSPNETHNELDMLCNINSVYQNMNYIYPTLFIKDLHRDAKDIASEILSIVGKSIAFESDAYSNMDKGVNL